jgi:hypothetical protein
VAYDTALSELPLEVRPAVRAYAEARRAEYEARSALSDLMITHRLRWLDVERLARTLT